MSTYLTRLYRSFVVHVIDVPPRLLAFLILLGLLAFPITLPTDNLLKVLITANLLAIYAASWDLLVGRCGQISLGHTLFFGVGAYTTALLMLYVGLPIWITIPAGVIVGTLIAVPAGFPAIRVKGPYLALVTMALPLIGQGIVLATRDVTMGETGIPIGTDHQFFPFLGINANAISSPKVVAEYYLTLIILLISAIALYKIAYSKLGIIFISVLDDEVSSKASGINVTKYKLMAFALSSLFASLAGALTAHSLISRVVGPSGMLSLTQSFIPIIMTTFGGIGTIYGPLVGAFIVTTLDGYILGIEVLNVPHVWHPLFYVIPVTLIIVLWPRGIARFITDKLGDLEKARDLDERGPKIWKTYKKKKKSKGVNYVSTGS